MRIESMIVTLNILKKELEKAADEADKAADAWRKAHARDNEEQLYHKWKDKDKRLEEVRTAYEGFRQLDWGASERGYFS